MDGIGEYKSDSMAWDENWTTRHGSGRVGTGRDGTGRDGTGRLGTERVGKRGDGTGCGVEIHLRMNGFNRTEQIRACLGTVVLFFAYHKMLIVVVF